MSKNVLDEKKSRKTKPDGADGHRGRMFDKFLASIDGDVLPRDIIEMLLYFPIRVRDTRDAAVHLMKKFGSTDKLFEASVEDLSDTEGVGKASATFLNMVGSTVKRMSDEVCDNRKVYSDISEIPELFKPLQEGLRCDITAVACLDSAMRPIKVVKIKNGVISRKNDDVRALVTLATEHHASQIAIARLSASCDDYPCGEDIVTAQYFEKLFNAVGLTLIDYFIINRDEALQVRKFYF